MPSHLDGLEQVLGDLNLILPKIADPLSTLAKRLSQYRYHFLQGDAYFFRRRLGGQVRFGAWRY